MRVSTITREHRHDVAEELTHQQVDVTRVQIDRRVDNVPPVRTEGDTTIVPVVEEIVVVERHLILKEEVRIRRVSQTEVHRETVVLRDQEAVVTRIPNIQHHEDNSYSGHITPEEEQ